MKQRIISMILCLALLVGLMPSISAAATETKNGTKATMVGTNSVGTMIADELKNVEQDAGDPNVLQDLTIENGTATVRFTTTEEAELVVAIYEEASGRQVTSAKATVHKDDTTAALTLDASALPQYFRAEAFLLSAKDYTPLCESLSTPMYTQAFQELLQKSADDFDSDRVLNLDEDKNTNFAVYGDDVKRSESDGTVNTVQSADDEALRYVIDNPDSTVTSLQPGDFWSCEGAEEILIVKVKSVTVQGNQAIITGQDTSMEEVFDYAKIEGDATAEDAVVDASQMADGVTYNGVVDMEQGTRAVSGEGSLKRGWSFSLNKEIEGDEASAKLSLSLALSVTTKLTYYIAKSDSYISFTQDYKMSVKGELENKLTLYEIPLTLVPIVIPICGVINIEVEPNLVAEFSATVSIDTSLTWTTGLTYEQGKGFRNASSKPTTSAELSIEGTLFIGASVNVKFCIISSYICSIGVGFQAGAEINAKLTGRERENGKIHACDGCLDGSIHVVLRITASAELFKVIKISSTIVEFKLLLHDFYNSLTYHESGWGDCPHWYDEGSEPEKPTEPTEPTEPTDPTEPTEPTEPSEVIDSGTCGENLTWTLDKNGDLTISGAGAMYDYSYSYGNSAPWCSQGYESKVKRAIINEGVTSIGGYAFYGCSGLTSITIPSGVTSIGYGAFGCCSGLTSIYFCGNTPSFGDNVFYNVSATAYYPVGNSTWTDEVKQNYGGNLTWAPWTPTNGAAAAPEVRGLHTGKVNGSTVSFSDLTPGAQYVLIVSRDKNSDLLASGNLLFIAQAAANADGTLAFTPAPQEAAANAFVGLYGQGETISGGYEPCNGVNCPGKTFADMPAKGNWAHDPIDWAVSNEITNGTSASTFSPEEGCTRAQVVTFLWRAAGQPAPASSMNPFTDVKPGAYYYNAVLWAVEKGITNGTSDKTFSPDETCTRAQIVTFLWRYEEQPALTGTNNPFADVKPSAYFGSAVLWAVEKGITNGTSATTFDPEDTCTRAQVVTFLYRDIVKS